MNTLTLVSHTVYCKVPLVVGLVNLGMNGEYIATDRKIFATSCRILYPHLHVENKKAVYHV